MNADFSFISLILNAGFLVQLIMFGLLCISVMSWTLIINRLGMLTKAADALTKFEMKFGDSLDKLYDHLNSKRGTDNGIEKVIRSGMREYVRLAPIATYAPAGVIDATTRAIKVALRREHETLEKGLPYLATVGSLSVYIGLFGTVWGIMNAFRSLGTAQQATLAMVAPGISEALIATAMGLFAAIPAVFAYNRFTHQINSLMTGYGNFAEEFVGSLHRKLLMDGAQNAPTK